MADKNFTSGTDKWSSTLASSDLSVSSSKTITIPTKGKYLDRNIEIIIPKATDITGTAAGSVTMTKGAGSCSYSTNTNVSASTSTNSSGCSVTFTGSGAVSATAKITTAGYTPTTDSFATGASTSSNSATGSVYINGVTLTAPSSGTRTFTITVPNGTSSTTTFTFKVDSSSNVWVE